MPEIVVVGAGNIGRGLLGELASKAGWEITFVETVSRLAQKLRAASSYLVRLSGTESSTTAVSGYSVVEPADTAGLAAAVHRAVVSSGFIAVAVGPLHLSEAARCLAPAIQHTALSRRIHKGKFRPVTILLCENKRTAAAEFADSLTAAGVLPSSFSTVATSVERMVRPDSGSLDCFAEAEQTLFIDSPAWHVAASLAPPASLLTGVLPVENIDAYYARKLYTNNAGHALLAYMGGQQGHETIADAAKDKSIRVHLNELLEASKAMLEMDYGLDGAELYRHIRELLDVRYPNKGLADPITRVARDPIRKLGPEERLVGLLRRLDRHGLPTDAVCQTIAAAMRYRGENDSESGMIERLTAEGGPQKVLETVTGIRPEDPYFLKIIQYYEEKKNG